MFDVTVTGWFAAAHQLRLPNGLEPLHGHNWRVAVSFCGEKLDSHGLLVDFTHVRPRLERVLAAMHDRNLNDLPQFRDCNPSAEEVARHIASAMAAELPSGVRLREVSVEEAPGCTAAYRPA